MSKKVIIIEAPNKVNGYKKYAGKEYDVLASYGHCVDLPEKGLGINIKKSFEPTFEVKDDHQDTINAIKSKCAKSDLVLLMTDPDREGEAISFHIYEQIKDIAKKVLRASTSEITASGIKKAIENAGELDQGKINAYLARRLLDRLVGYRTSFLTQQATGGKSAGRVQSAVLRILVDRENEILHFIPEEYWIFTARLLSSKNEQYTASLSDKFKVPNEAEATKIYDAVIGGNPVVASVESKDVKSNPYAPFATMPLIAAASSILGWQTKKTMDVAQNLYSNGLISYHRTDSVTIAEEPMQAIRNYISHTYGSDYIPDKPNYYSAKKGAQEAHEACRPTDISNVHPSAPEDNGKLYEIIWRRTVASQMTPGLDKKSKVITDISEYEFVSNGNQMLFDGHRQVWHYGKSDDVILPNLFGGEKCKLLT
jgi:DNA topoisomerase-1